MLEAEAGPILHHATILVAAATRASALNRRSEVLVLVLSTGLNAKLVTESHEGRRV